MSVTVEPCTVTSQFGLSVRGIGFTPALIALALYGILPILRNTVTGIAGVDPALVEAARGVGMTDRERLRRVELPLALPVIVAGLVRFRYPETAGLELEEINPEDA